jgi:hypothetical protein
MIEEAAYVRGARLHPTQLGPGDAPRAALGGCMAKPILLAVHHQRDELEVLHRELVSRWCRLRPAGASAENPVSSICAEAMT